MQDENSISVPASETTATSLPVVSSKSESSQAVPTDNNNDDNNDIKNISDVPVEQGNMPDNDENQHLLKPENSSGPAQEIPNESTITPQQASEITPSNEVIESISLNSDKSNINTNISHSKDDLIGTTEANNKESTNVPKATTGSNTDNLKNFEIETIESKMDSLTNSEIGTTEINPHIEKESLENKIIKDPVCNDDSSKVNNSSKDEVESLSEKTQDLLDDNNLIKIDNNDRLDEDFDIQMAEADEIAEKEDELDDAMLMVHQSKQLDETEKQELIKPFPSKKPALDNDDNNGDNLNNNVDADENDKDNNISAESSDSKSNTVENRSTNENFIKKPLKQEVVTTKFEPTLSTELLKRQTHIIVLPSYASWFSMKKINKIEEESLPEFFNNLNRSKTPGIYMKYRNFMVNSYRINPNDYLSFTSVRRNLIGDAGTLLRVHKFLNKWGLINYQVNPETRPVAVEPPDSSDFIVDLDTPRGMFPFESYKPQTEFPDLSKFKSILNEKPEVDDAAEPPTKRQKIIKPDINSGWSVETTAKLIEGVNKHRSNWYKIAEFVGDKTPDQCIIRFLKLPMEDKFLEKNKNLLGPLKYIPNLTFSPSDNPIMSTLAFLVKLVDPDVAAAASNRAIEVVDKKLERKLNRNKKIIKEDNIRKDPLKDIKDAAANSFGIIGAKSHLFACFEEREINKSFVNIIQNQLKIVDLKLNKLTALEKEYELQRKQLNKKADELFLEKLSMFKYANSATSKLVQAVDIMELKAKESPDDKEVEKVKKLLSQAKDILFKPPRKQMNVLEEGDGEAEKVKENEDENLKPVSFEAPMLYRYWSG